MPIVERKIRSSSNLSKESIYMESNPIVRIKGRPKKVPIYFLEA